MTRDELAKELGELLRIARLRADMSQKQMAAAVGWKKPNQVHKVEKGANSPRSDTMMNLFAAAGVDVMALIRGALASLPPLPPAPKPRRGVLLRNAVTPPQQHVSIAAILHALAAQHVPHVDGDAQLPVAISQDDAALYPTDSCDGYVGLYAIGDCMTPAELQ